LAQARKSALSRSAVPKADPDIRAEDAFFGGVVHGDRDAEHGGERQIEMAGVAARAAQIMIWTFIIQYAANELGMAIFVTSRFICTFLLKYVSPGGLLGALALGGLILTLGTIFVQGMAGLYCLIGISACMSLMFPTIYGIALEGLRGDAKLGAAGLIFAIGGGCLMTPMQGAIMDMPAFHIGGMVLSSTRASFFLPALCFVVIAGYGFWVKNYKPRSA
jgi:FHS family L-fucose permease-like MFS transporter